MVSPSVLHMSIAHISRPSKDNEHAHVQYVVCVSDERFPGLQWTVYRRFSEFRAFRTQLEEAAKHNEMCTHCVILSKRTSFPHRRLFGNNRDTVVESRRLGLIGFLEAVAKHARACRESTKCRTRPLMDQFLNAHDMRYTFLNVGVDNGDHPEMNHPSFHSKVDRLMNGNSKLFSASSSSAWKPETDKNHKSSNNQLEEMASSVSESTSKSNVEGRVLTGKRSVPNLLEYARKDRSSKHIQRAHTSRQTRHSFNDESSSSITPIASSSKLLHWETAKYQTANAGRFSDPGMSRSDILSFSVTATARRPRRVHLSSAAKRIKKLEEQEAFHIRSQLKKKQVMKPLATIVEDPYDTTDSE